MIELYISCEQVVDNFFLYQQAVLSQEKLPSLDGVLIGGKNLQYSMYIYMID